MSRADELYRQTCLDILNNGFSDEGLDVRPRWADGTPAHTIKKFGVVNRYNLAEEFPIMTLRRTYWKSAVVIISTLDQYFKEMYQICIKSAVLSVFSL